MSNGPLVNQLGTGVIPPEKEARLIARGIQFAAYLEPGKSKTLVTSKHPCVYQRFAEQLERQWNEDHGLPIKYRVPTPASEPRP